MNQRYALVTAGAQGLGSAMARHLGRQGYSLFIHYYTSREGAEALRAEVAAADGEAVCVQADLARAEGREALMAEIADRAPAIAPDQSTAMNRVIGYPLSRLRAGKAVLPEESASGPGRAAYRRGLAIRTRISPIGRAALHRGHPGAADGLPNTRANRGWTGPRAGDSHPELPPVGPGGTRVGGTPEPAGPPLPDRKPDGDEHERPSRPRA